MWLTSVAAEGVEAVQERRWRRMVLYGVDRYNRVGWAKEEGRALAK